MIAELAFNYTIRRIITNLESHQDTLHSTNVKYQTDKFLDSHCKPCGIFIIRDQSFYVFL